MALAEQKIASKRYAARGRVVLCVSTIIFAVSVLFPKRIVDLYLYEESSETIQYAVRAVRVYGISFLLMGINILMGCYYAAVEKVVWSYVISFGRSFVLISFLLLLSKRGVWRRGDLVGGICQRTYCFCCGHIRLLQAAEERISAFSTAGRLRLLNETHPENWDN